MKLFICVLCLVALVVLGLTRGWIITWGTFTDADLDEMGVNLGRKKEENSEQDFD